MTVTCTGDDYAASVDYWYHLDPDAGKVKLSEGDTFGCGTYGLRVYFTAKPGYAFDSDTVFTINGKATSLCASNYGRHILFEPPHTHVEEAAEQTETCTVDGHLKHYICEDCGRYSLDGTFTDAVKYDRDILLRADHRLDEHGVCTRCGHGAVSVEGSVSNGTVTVTVDDLEQEALLFAAQYKDGKLVDIKMITVSGSKAYSIPGFTDTEGCTYKVFLTGTSNQEPLCPEDTF